MSNTLNTPNLNNNAETDETDTLHTLELTKTNVADIIEGEVIVKIKKSNTLMAPK